MSLNLLIRRESNVLNAMLGVIIEQRLDVTGRPTMSSAAATAASEAGDENIKECGNGSDDALEYASDTVDDSHEAGADGAEHASDLSMM
jgi:hypothetical protein